MLFLTHHFREIRPSTDSLEGWTHIFRIADSYSHPELRALAVIEMSRFLMDPVAKITLANSLRISEWLPDAYAELAARSDPLSREEIDQIGQNSATEVLRLRDGLDLEDCVVVDLNPSPSDSECGSPIELLTREDLETLFPAPALSHDGSVDSLPVPRVVAVGTTLPHKPAEPLDACQVTPPTKPLTPAISDSDLPATTEATAEDIHSHAGQCAKEVVPSDTSAISPSHPFPIEELAPFMTIEEAESALSQALAEEAGAKAALEIVNADVEIMVQVQSTMENINRRADSQTGPLRRALFGAVRRVAFAVVKEEVAQRELVNAQEAQAAAQELLRKSRERVEILQAGLEVLRIVERADASKLALTRGSDPSSPGLISKEDVCSASGEPLPSAVDGGSSHEEESASITPTPSAIISPSSTSPPSTHETTPTLPPTTPEVKEEMYKSLFTQFCEWTEQAKRDEMDRITADHHTKRVSARRAQIAAERRQSEPVSDHKNPISFVPTSAAQAAAAVTLQEAKHAAEFAIAEQDHALADLDIATEDLVSADLLLSSAEEVIRRAASEYDEIKLARLAVARRQAQKDVMFGRRDIERARTAQRDAQVKVRAASERVIETVAALDAAQEWLVVLQPKNSRADALRRSSSSFRPRP